MPLKPFVIYVGRRPHTDGLRRPESYMCVGCEVAYFMFTNIRMDFVMDGTP